MKKNNISTIGFIIISIITVVFIVYYSESTVQTAISIKENNKLIVQKPDVIIEYYNQDNDFIVDGEKIIYISLDILSEHLNTRTSFDPEDNIAIITTLDKVIRFYGETDRVKVNGMEVDYISPMIMYDKKLLIPVSQIEESLKIESNIIENSNNIIIRSLLDNERVGETDRSIVTLKRDKSPWSEVIGVLSRGDKIQIISEDNEWMKILTDGGMEGFVKKGTIGKIEKIMGLEDEKNTSIWKPEKDRISLTWEHVHSRNPDTKKIKEMEGVNVISPTWIKLSSPSGGLKSNISKNYIDWAKGRGYKIWVLFSNSFDPDLTDKFLNNSIARERVINDLLEMIKDNDIDGINIDFENVYVKNKELLVQFVREMTPVFHENG
ncbi:MAG: stalk domain-containing protein, partial [Clostridia bacterium]|nr:stalk domain-containing protein [Clostridia bacterium]